MEHKEEAVRSKFGRACVFCASSFGGKESYKTAATELGQELVSRGVNLVYGGGGLGLMGSVSKAVHDGGGHVFGIIPRDLLPVEITGETYGEEIRVTDMHERKAKMAREADCFIALPGGFGTLEELLEVVSWYKLGIHDKPVGVLNVDGFFNLFLSSIDNSVDEGFIHPSHHHIIVVASNAKELLDKLEEYEPVPEQQEQQEIHVGFNVAPAPPVAATLETDGGEEARSG
ncbi:hypothetical protein ACLB2K_024192 [Fragaria x ananassa]